MVVVHGSRNACRRGGAVLLALSLMLVPLTGCQTLITTMKAEDGTRQTVIRFGIAGRLLEHDADVVYEWEGDGAGRMQTGDSVDEMSVDPEVAKAIVQGAVSAIMEIVNPVPVIVP